MTHQTTNEGDLPGTSGIAGKRLESCHGPTPFSQFLCPSLMQWSSAQYLVVDRERGLQGAPHSEWTRVGKWTLCDGEDWSTNW